MPSALTYPGVYVEEIPSGVRTITGVATSVTAFIGRARMGPVSKATTINSFGDFERIFGGLWALSEMSFAVRDFYLNGGSKAVIVRLYHPTFSSEAERASVKAAGKQVADAAKAAAAAAPAPGGGGGAPAGGAAPAPAGPGAAAKAAANTLNGTIQGGPLSPIEKQAAADVNAALQTLADDATSADVAKLADDTVAAISRPGFAELNVGRGAANLLALKARWPGAWANSLRGRIDYDVPAGGFGGIASASLFNLAVKDTRTGTTEVFRNVTHLAGTRNVATVLENESKLVAVAAPPAGRPPQSDDAPLPDADKVIVPFSAKDTGQRSSGVLEAGKGDDGSALSSGDYEGSELARTGIFALEQLFARDALFNLLCIPHSLDDQAAKDIAGQAISYCEKRRAMFIMDPLPSWANKSNDERIATIGDLEKSRNAAIFFPRLAQPNPVKDGLVEAFAPCGAVAGVFARTDTRRGVWKAPAGLEANLIGVPALTVGLTDEENGDLNPKGINCLRAFPAAGRVVWGSRTMRGDDGLADEYKYIPVRRTALYIEESLYRGTQWAVFEPNDEPLWAQLRLNIGAFMNNLFRQGAFQGKTSREAYFVKCDKETTTQNDINLGIVNIHVGFAPLKPAEFVVLKIQQITGDIQT
jgi:phage tail sheath protein FI